MLDYWKNIVAMSKSGRMSLLIFYDFIMAIVIGRINMINAKFISFILAAL